MRAVPVVLALLLLCSAASTGGVTAARFDGTSAASTPSATAPSIGAAVASATAVNATNGSVGHRVLSIPRANLSNANVGEARLDAGVAVSLGANASAERMETIALRQHIRAAESNDERQRRILDGMNELEKRVVTLRTMHRTAIAQFAAGTIDARELYVRLARIKAESDALERRLAVLSRLAGETNGNTLTGGRAAALELQLRSFDGPVRSRALAAIRGDAPPTRVYAAASAQSVVLATVVDGEYVREVYRGDLRSLRGNSITRDHAMNVTARSYPEIWAVHDGQLSATTAGGTGIVTVPYPGGSLTTFVDGGSDHVFKEYQRVQLENVTTGEVRSRTIDLTLRVNRTYAGGPLRIEVVDPETGEPVNASVKIAIDGQGSVGVGMTGEDGVVWTVAPRGTFVVTALDEDSDDLSTLELSSYEPVSVRETYAPNGSGSVS